MSTPLTLHTVAEVADILGISRQAVQQQIDSKSIQADWMLGRWAISSHEIERQKERRRITVSATKRNGK